MTERRFMTWAIVAAVFAALLPWLILPLHLAVVIGPVTAVLAAASVIRYRVRARAIYRRK